MFLGGASPFFMDRIVGDGVVHVTHTRGFTIRLHSNLENPYFKRKPIPTSKRSGWNCGSILSTDHEGRQFWVVAAERADAGRFIAHAHDVPAAVLELQAAIHGLFEVGKNTEKSSLTISRKPDGAGAACQPWIRKAAQSGLPTRIA